MKEMRKRFRTLVTYLSLVGLTMNFSACSNDSTLSPESAEPEANGLTLATAWITKTAGGQLKYEFDGSRFPDPAYKDVYGKVTLDVPAQSVDESVQISIEFDPSVFYGNMNMDYSPHGLIFKQPAILNIEARGLDLSQLSAAAAQQFCVFYINQETGALEEMQADQLFIEIETGTVKVVNARLPHFSRYAIAWSN